MVTPVLNESNKQANSQLDEIDDTLSIDSFETLPIDLQQVSNQIQNPTSLSNHPSFFLLNGFTAEFKFNKDAKKADDKQIQVDIRYLPIENSKTSDLKNDQFKSVERIRSNRFRDIDAQVPTFYVLDDLFGDNFKKRSSIKRKETFRTDLIRSGKMNLINMC